MPRVAPPFPRAFLGSLSALGLAAGLVISLWALGGVPHVQDEVAYLLQARIFAHGHRVAPLPVDGLLQAGEFQLLEPGWHGVFPIGWPLLLAVGVKAGAPWLVNPLLLATLPWLAWAAFARWMPDERAARFVALLSVASPGILLLGGSMMSHTSALACALALTAAVSAGPPSARLGLLGGAAAAWLVLTRPYDALLFVSPALLALLRAHGLRRLLPVLAPVVVACVATAVDNVAMTGSPTTFPVDRYFATETPWQSPFRPGCNRLGFGADRGCMAAHAAEGYLPLDAPYNLWMNASRFDALLFGMPGVGAGVEILGLILLGRRAPLLAFPAGVVPLGYLLYWYNGVCYGARFWHLAYVAALPAAGLAFSRVPARVPRWLVLGLFLAASAWTTARAAGELRDRYWCVDAALPARVAAAGVDRGVVLYAATGSRRLAAPLTTTGRITCSARLAAGSVLGGVDPLEEGAPLTWLRDPESLGERLPPVLARHPGAPVWRVVEDLRSGESTLSRWDGARFEAPRPLP